MIDPNTVGVVMEAPKKQGDTFKRLVERVLLTSRTVEGQIQEDCRWSKRL